MTIEINKTLNQPPIYQENITRNNRLNPIWQKWFTAVHQTHIQFFKTFNAKIKLTPLPVEHVNEKHVLLGVTSLTQAEQDNIVNVDDGTFMYNLTTKKVNVREDGVWKEIT